MFPRVALVLRFRVSVFCTAVRRACITAVAMVMGIHAWSKILFVKDLVSSGRQGGAAVAIRCDKMKGGVKKLIAAAGAPNRQR